MNHFDVIIVGLGPSGSIAALLLETYGIKVLAIEKEKEIYNLPRAVTISDQGFRMSQLAGIDHIYEENSTVLGGARFTDKDLNTIGNAIELDGLISPNGWPPSSLFHQPYTDQAIREKLNNSKVEVLLEHEFKNLNHIDNQNVIKVFNLKEQKEVEFTCRYLIGSDGGSSLVRKELNIQQIDLEYNRDWVVVDVELMNENTLGNQVIQVCDRERLSTFVPSHLPFRRWEYIIHEHEDKNTFLDEKKIQELISKWLKPEEYRIIRKAVYQFHSVIAKNFQKDNCFLVGDAAHQAPPFMGEGMMSGYRDAVNLAWKIAVTIKNELNNKLLKSYEEERIAHSKFVVENSAGIGELMEAYAQASDPEEVPRELVAKGYGSFVLPNLSNGLFFGGKANETMHSGEIFPQPLQYHNSKIVKRMDHILGSKFCLVSESKFSVSEENKRFLELLGCKSLILKKEYIDENSWLNFFMEQGKTYLIRPDRYIFGSTTSHVTLNELIDDLKIRINLENTI